MIATRDFDGLVAVVTGGGSGIGAACTERLASRGARVAVLDRDAAERDPYLSVVADVTQPLEPAIEQVASALGGIDILVNSAAC